MGETDIRDLALYDPETGWFSWRKRRSGCKFGSRAGSKNKIHGYRVIGVGGKSYREHVLAFFMMTGEFPEGDIDHINGVKDDNRWCNLRECSRTQNMLNINKKASNKSGFTGVSFDKQRGLWLAQIRIDGKKKNLGRYKTKEDAHAAWKKAASSDLNHGYRKSI